MNKFLLDIPERIETERLYLRAYKAGDGPMYYAAGIRNREHLAEFESGNILMHLKNEEHAEAVVRELAADWMARNCFFIGIFEKATDEWAGQVYVAPTNWELPEFFIGYVADVDCEGKGYISEAVNGVLGMLFGELGAHRVKSDCNQNNIRSWRLLERCGFRREGHLRENRRNADGSLHGDFLYALLRREYVDR
jgi:RimJ/RimL family protein N-acetyltransferase